MKKFTYIFLLGCILILGIMMGKPTRESTSDQLRDEIEDFENIITKPNNNYTPKKSGEIEPNLSNSMAKTGENIVTGVFRVAFNFIEKLAK